MLQKLLGSCRLINRMLNSAKRHETHNLLHLFVWPGLTLISTVPAVCDDPHPSFATQVKSLLLQNEKYLQQQSIQTAVLTFTWSAQLYRVRRLTVGQDKNQLTTTRFMQQNDITCLKIMNPRMLPISNHQGSSYQLSTTINKLFFIITFCLLKSKWR